MRAKSILRGGALLLAAVLAVSCSHKSGWKVEGTVANAEKGAKVALDGFNGTSWYTIDSLEIGGNGKFGYQAATATANPDIYRVVLDGKSIYFPIDSAETVTIEADAASFDRGYKLGGSATAQKMMEIDQMIAARVDELGVAAREDSALKRQLIDVIVGDSVGSLSYYLINKTIGNAPIFAEDNRLDVRILGAVANRFDMTRPNDPRTKPLAERLMRARKNLGLVNAVAVEAEVMGLIDIVLADNTGKPQSLRDVADGAGVTLLSFTSYELENSPAYNLQLKKLSDMFAGNKLAIYQVSVDGDEVFWMQAANNLPWTTVRYDGNSPALTSYLVDAVPLTFVIDGKGDIRERVEDPNELEAAIRRALK